MSASSKPTCRLVRPGKTYDGKQGLTYFEGIAAETVGSHGICMHLLTMPPGARAKAHLHESHETAIYVLSGEVDTWYGDGSNTTSSSRPATSSTSRPACRICRPISATSRLGGHRPHRSERTGERRAAAASGCAGAGLRGRRRRTASRTRADLAEDFAVAAVDGERGGVLLALAGSRSSACRSHPRPRMRTGRSRPCCRPWPAAPARTRRPRRSFRSHPA